MLESIGSGMNLEDRINQAIKIKAEEDFERFYITVDMFPGFDEVVPIQEWVWPSGAACGEAKGSQPFFLFRGAYVLVNQMIESADLAECLTSPCSYIRECRKWQEAKKDTDARAGDQ